MSVNPEYTIVSLSERPDLVARQDQFGGDAWPEFMLHDPVPMKHWGGMLRDFADFQLLMLDGGEILAAINAVPLYVEGDYRSLPDRGVCWGLEKSIADFSDKTAPNSLMAIQIVVGKTHRRRGLSAIATEELKRLASRKAIEKIIVPVRPNGKHRFPLIPMEEYVGWRTADGLPYDNWLRVHVRAGGRILNVCAQSMRITGTCEEWESWTGLQFPGSGRYVVPQALVPVEFDLGRDLGIYLEPNVWVLHHAET